MTLADCTDNQWVDCFQEQAEQILGIDSQELGAMSIKDGKAFDKVFSSATYQRFTLKLKANADFYNNDKRVSHTLVSAVPIDFKEHNKKMIQDLEEAGIPLPPGIKREKYL